jgi:hypothetical protein
MQCHQRRERRDDLRRQHWKRHDNLQDEVRKLLHREKDGEDDEEDAVSPFRWETERRGTVREKLGEIIRSLALSLGISR